MGFIERMKDEARAKMNKLVLPEGKDSRVLNAAKILIEEDLVSEVALVGDTETILANAKAEGINNVIKTLLKRAYGYKNFDYFRRKVLQRCGYLMNYSTHTF